MTSSMKINSDKNFFFIHSNVVIIKFIYLSTKLELIFRHTIV